MFKELTGNYLLACSGGPDSMALFDMLLKNNIKFSVAHVNYHHRDTANRDQKIVSDFCKNNNIDFYVSDYIEGKGNFQDLARVFRYDFFRRLVKDLKLDGVLVAHQLDDLIETYLLQIKRGSTPSVYGISDITELNGLKVYRPLLNYSKEELLKYCDELSIPYGIDESNLTADFKRNEIRHDVIEKLTNEEKNKLLKEIKDLNDELNNRKNSVKEYLDKEYLTVEEYKNIKDYKMYLRLKVDMGLSDKHIEDIHNQLLNAKKVNISLNDLMIVKEYDCISVFTRISDYEYIINEGEFIDTPYFKFEKSGTNFEAINLKDEDYPLTIRNFKNGDAISLRYGTKKVSRFFIDKKIPCKERIIWPVVLNSKKEVIHVPGIGSNVKHFAKDPTIFMVKL